MNWDLLHHLVELSKLEDSTKNNSIVKFDSIVRNNIKDNTNQGQQHIVTSTLHDKQTELTTSTSSESAFSSSSFPTTAQHPNTASPRIPYSSTAFNSNPPEVPPGEGNFKKEPLPQGDLGAFEGEDTGLKSSHVYYDIQTKSPPYDVRAVIFYALLLLVCVCLAILVMRLERWRRKNAGRSYRFPENSATTTGTFRQTTTTGMRKGFLRELLLQKRRKRKRSMSKLNCGKVDETANGSENRDGLTAIVGESESGGRFERSGVTFQLAEERGNVRGMDAKLEQDESKDELALNPWRLFEDHEAFYFQIV